MLQDFGALLLKNGGSGNAGEPLGVDPGSVLGLYLRKCRAVVGAMPFEAVASLYLDIDAALAAALSGCAVGG